MEKQSTSAVIQLFLVICAVPFVSAEDYLRDLQTAAAQKNYSPAAHWGYDPAKYTQWGSHSNRLIPVYTFGTRGAGAGVDLESYLGKNSPYRNEESLKKIYGYLPTHTVSSSAEYMDQTNIYDIQAAAAKSGKKHIFLVVFDGMDWDTTRAAAIYNSKSVPYDSGRGKGTHMQDYTASGTSQFGFMVTAPHNEGTKIDVNEQRVVDFTSVLKGGYDPVRGGPNPWTLGTEKPYLISQPKDAEDRHAYTDSSCSASSMTTGIKSYNGAVNVDPLGRPVPTIAHQLQQQGWAVGAVSSVPISHATPAAAYSHNVDRDDFQDLTRDMLGLPSISHPGEGLSGLDVVIGCGFGVETKADVGQGKNFIPGNRYLTAEDRNKIDARNGGKYVIAERTKGVAGSVSLSRAVDEAVKNNKRLFGLYGTHLGNLPFQTANGDFQPAPGRKGAAVSYKPEDIQENPTLADMTAAAIRVVEKDPEGFWLLIESGDVDWANHDNNLDASIGAVNSGDAAIKTITDWVERSSNWEESLLIVTADHGHYLNLVKPEMLVPPASKR